MQLPLLQLPLFYSVDAGMARRGEGTYGGERVADTEDVVCPRRRGPHAPGPLHPDRTHYNEQRTRHNAHCHRVQASAANQQSTGRYAVVAHAHHTARTLVLDKIKPYDERRDAHLHIGNKAQSTTRQGMHFY